MKKVVLKTVGVGLIALSLAGCATKGNPDPYEGYNRAMFKFNAAAYEYAVGPVTDGYTYITPAFFREGTRNFFDNTFEVPRFGNSILQADPGEAGKHALRLVLNTVFGVFGLFDVASTMGLPAEENNFGLTLAKWGYRDSPYFVLPFMGPSTVRDTIGLIPDYFMNPFNLDFYFNSPRFVNVYLNYGLSGLYVVNTGAEFLPKYYNLTDYAIDPYIAVRNAYLQYTNAKIKERFDSVEIGNKKLKSVKKSANHASPIASNKQ